MLQKEPVSCEEEPILARASPDRPCRLRPITVAASPSPIRRPRPVAWFPPAHKSLRESPPLPLRLVDLPEAFFLAPSLPSSHRHTAPRRAMRASAPLPCHGYRSSSGQFVQ